jgi:hypothetical protein
MVAAADRLVLAKARTLKGTLLGLYRTPTGASGDDGFVTEAVDTLPLSLDGIEGDRHGGPTRRSGGREPWYPRGTLMRNERQLSILAPDELAAIATDMGVAEIRAEWIGGNLLVGGLAHLTLLPARTLLFIEGGVTLRIDGLNQPCRFSGRSVARQYPGQSGLDLAFVKAAARRRGLVGWVEKPGTIATGAAVEARIPEHWIYPGAITPAL